MADQTIDELVDDIIALGTDHSNGRFPDGLKKDGTYAPQDKGQAKAQLKSIIETMMAEVVGESAPDWRQQMCPYCYEDEEGGLTPFKAGWEERGVEQRQRIPQVIAKYFDTEEKE